MARATMTSGSKKNPGAKNSKGMYKDPAAAIGAGLMKKKESGIVSPGKIVAKLGAKVADKLIKKAATKPSIVKAAAKGYDKLEVRKVTKGATNITKEAAREKQIVNKMQAEMVVAKKKALKIAGNYNKKQAAIKNSKKAFKVAKNAKPLAEPKSAVKLVPKMPKGMTKAKNDYATAQAKRIASGKAAKTSATGKTDKAMPKGMTMAQELKYKMSKAPKATENVKPVPKNDAAGAAKLRKLMNGPKRTK